MIHAQALVDPSADLADDVTVGPFSVIGPDVVIGEKTEIGPHVVITGKTTIGKANKIYQFSSIGEDPQDKKYHSEETGLSIGDNNVIREFATIHKGTVQDQGLTRIGSDNLLMAYTHVAHDCVLADNVILANAASLGGHVQIDDWAILGGFTIVHQFSRIGEHSFASMGSAIKGDVPPYFMIAGQPAKARGINQEGLKRRGFGKDDIRAIKNAYKMLHSLTNSLDDCQQKLLDMDNAYVSRIQEFIHQRQRGIIR